MPQKQEISEERKLLQLRNQNATCLDDYILQNEWLIKKHNLRDRKLLASAPQPPFDEATDTTRFFLLLDPMVEVREVDMIQRQIEE